MNNEVWKQLEDYPNYFVSNTGKVRNIKTGRELQQSLTAKGYLVVNLCKNRKPKKFKVHRLVAQAFILNPDNLDTVDHINGLKTDNRSENLQWLSRHDNTSRFYREQQTEEQREHYKVVHVESIKKALEKATEVNKKPIVCLDTGKIYGSITQASRELNLSVCHISQVCKGKQKTTGGYHFKFLF